MLWCRNQNAWAAWHSSKHQKHADSPDPPVFVVLNPQEQWVNPCNLAVGRPSNSSTQCQPLHEQALVFGGQENSEGHGTQSARWSDFQCEHSSQVRILLGKGFYFSRICGSRYGLGFRVAASTCLPHRKNA